MYQVKNVGTSPPALWENWALVPLDDVIVTVHMSMRIFLLFADCWFQFFSFCTLLGKMFPPDFQLCFHELKQLKQLQPCIYCPHLEFPIYILIQWFKHRNSIAQLKKIDGDRWPCLLYRPFTSYVGAFTRVSGFWSIPIPSVRSIMYGRLSCLYISPKKTETQSLQYSTWHLWLRMISACFSSFETTWSMFFHDCHGLFCQVLTDKEAFQAQFFCVSGCWRKKWLWQFISTLD